MATSTLIQFLSEGAAGDTMHRRQTETFIANGAITKGDWLQVDTTKTGADRVLFVVQAGGNATGNGLVVGVALATVGAGESIEVVVQGYVEGANVANAVGGAAVPLVVDATAAGRAVAIAAADLAPPCGISLEAAAGDACDVMVYKNF